MTILPRFLAAFRAIQLTLAEHFQLEKFLFLPSWEEGMTPVIYFSK